MLDKYVHLVLPVIMAGNFRDNTIYNVYNFCDEAKEGSKIS